MLVRFLHEAPVLMILFFCWFFFHFLNTLIPPLHSYCCVAVATTGHLLWRAAAKVTQDK